MLKSAVAAALSAIVYNNNKNQTIALKNGIIRPLGVLLKSRNMTVQLKVSLALEALAVNNQATQEAILEYDAANYMIRLMEVKFTGLNLVYELFFLCEVNYWPYFTYFGEYFFYFTKNYIIYIKNKP